VKDKIASQGYRKLIQERNIEESSSESDHADEGQERILDDYGTEHLFDPRAKY